MLKPNQPPQAVVADLRPERDNAITVIGPPRGLVNVELAELWAYRELLFFLVWRDLKVRYRQTALGVAWAVIQPVFTTIVFSVFFGRLAGIPSNGIPYPVFAYAALLPWQLFAHALAESANSLVANQSLITKVYFPRLIVPVVPIVVGLADFGIAAAVLLGLMGLYGIVPTGAVVAAPLFVLLAVATSLAVGLWLSALNVKYRDVRYTLPFLTQFWLFATPVAYPSSLLSEPWRTWYGLNPMAGVVEGFRWALLGGPTPGPMVLVSAVVVIVALVGGVVYFRQVERTFADIV